MPGQRFEIEFSPWNRRLLGLLGLGPRWSYAVLDEQLVVQAEHDARPERRGAGPHEAGRAAR